MGRLPVSGILSQSHFVIRPPGDELKRTAARQGLMIEPAIAVTLDALARNDSQGGKAAEVQKESQGSVEFHAQGAVIECMNADLGGVTELSQVEWFRIFDIEKLAGIIGSRFRAERAYPGIYKIVRGDLLSGRPDKIAPKMESIDFAVRRNLPAFSQCRDRSGIRGVEPEKSLEEGLRHAHFRNAGDDRRIERFRLVAIDNDQIGGTFGSDASSEGQAKREAEWRDNVRLSSAAFAWAQGGVLTCA